jgi:methionyl-tRNA synthetase
MSKTLGTVLDPIQVAEKVGVDALRYFLIAEVPFDRDGDFTWERVQDRCNADLANGIGNLLARTTAMIGRYQEGEVIHPEGKEKELSEPFRKSIGFEERLISYDAAMNRLLPSSALESAWDLVRGLNNFIAEKKPFTLARDPSRKDDVAAILYVCAETLRILAILVHPVMPAASGRMWAQLGLPGRIEDQHVIDLSATGARFRDDARDWGHFPTGAQVTKGEALFPRLELLSPADANS